MERYDNGTRVWTTILGVTIAVVINWVLVVNPARGIVPDPPHTGWWLFALAAVCVPPGAWLIGKAFERNYVAAVVWFFVLAALVLAHYLPLDWAEGQQR
jgi:hypothetical protein